MHPFIAPPTETPLPLLADLAWHASYDLLEATRAGDRHKATIPAAWLNSTREHPNCTPALRRMAGHALEIGMAAFGGTAPRFEPLQSCDGESA
ncbi:hypothetical protein [Azorhizobium sp. AG788]|uniref:hypothetical protein n=1 Tax=Azorhizobium sp. AG788 TaxID=2183897 RepID=UPI00313932F6